MTARTSIVPQSVPAEGHCITCSDEGIALRLLRVGADGLALGEDEEGFTTDVDVSLVGDAGPGDLVLVHAGVAIAHLREGAP